MPWQGYGTGAVPREALPGDWQMDRLPEIEYRVAAGLPNSYLRVPLESVPASAMPDQGSSPRCVASSTCVVKAYEDFGDIGLWQRYDDVELYLACGGDGLHGIYTDTALKYARDTGVLLAGTQRRYRIASYMFAPQQARAFRETLCAAVMELGPCVVATLLPNGFGWNSGENPGGVETYHQMGHVGWDGLGDDGWAVFRNTWGAGFGERGFCRLRWRYLEQGGNFQNRYVYAYMLSDFVDGGVKPPDPPKKFYAFTAETISGAPETIQKDWVYELCSATLPRTDVCSLKVTDIRLASDPPDPKPPDPQPQPVGDLTIEAVVKRAGVLSLEARVRDGTQYVSAAVTAEVNGQGLGVRNTIVARGTVYPARWALPAALPNGTPVRVSASVGTKTGAVTVPV